MRTLNSAEEVEQFLFVPAWVPVYECMPIDEFNAAVRAEVCGLGARYCFNAPSHNDWVATRVWYKVGVAIGNEGDGKAKPEHWRPLNSWFLKDPVGLVPSEEKLKDEVCWRKRMGKVLYPSLVPYTTLDELHSYYLRKACSEVYSLRSLLSEWLQAGSPCEQEEWSFHSVEERKCFQSHVKQQRLNMLEARKKLELMQRTGAPVFLTEEAAGQSVKERKLLEQMQCALLAC